MKNLFLALLVVSPILGVAQAQTAVPAGYPATYAKLIDDAKKEQKLLVYSNVSTPNWTPFLTLARQRFPWLTIETTDSNELWEKYYAESSANTRTADLIVASTLDRWIEFMDRGQIANYASPEGRALPEWSKVFPGLYAASVDAMILAYNRRAFPDGKAPRSFGEVLAAAQHNPGWKGRITTYDAGGNSIGVSIYWAWLKARNNDWSSFDKLGPLLRPERSAGTMREKVTSGEYVMAIFTSGAGIPQYSQPATAKLTGWTFATDGTPVVMRGVAVTRSAGSPNSARLFLDLLLAREGQIAFAQGGQMPYRDDISKRDVPFETLGSVRAAVGDKNIIIVGYDRTLIANRAEFQARWQKALGR